VAGNFNLSFIIRAIDRATAPVRKVTKNFETMRKSWTKAQKSFARAAEMRQAAEGINTFARKTRGLLVAPINAFEEFEASIAELRGVSRLAVEPMAMLEKEALRLGTAVGEFDPTGAAKGMIELARAGYSAEEIMQALPTLLDLSTVAHLELAEATKITTGIMGGFGLEAAEATRVSDVLAAASTSSKTSIQTLGETFAYVGPVARKAGLSIEQTAIIAGALGNSSIEASRAGTALNAVLLRMAGARRGPGSKILKQMRIEMTTLAGNARDPIDILGDIGKKISGLGELKQLGLLGRIFGSEAAPSAAILAEALGDVRVEELTKNVNNAAGATRSMAEDFRKTGQNETMQLTSAINTLGIATGRTLKDHTREAKDAIKSVIEGITEWTAAHPDLTKAIMVTVGVVSILATLLAGMVFTLASVTVGLGVMAIAMGSNKTGAQVLGLAIRGTLLRLKAFAVAIWTTVVPALSAWAAGWWASVAPILAATWPILAIIAAIAALAAAVYLVYDNWQPIKEFFIGIWDSVVSGVKTAIEWIKKFALPEPLQKFIDWNLKIAKVGIGAAASALGIGGEDKPITAMGQGGRGGGDLGDGRLVVELRNGELTPVETQATGRFSVETETTGFLMQGVMDG
jgi:TP901 family phage tail tape measure protein